MRTLPRSSKDRQIKAQIDAYLSRLGADEREALRLREPTACDQARGALDLTRADFRRVLAIVLPPPGVLPQRDRSDAGAKPSRKPVDRDASGALAEPSRLDLAEPEPEGVTAAVRTEADTAAPTPPRRSSRTEIGTPGSQNCHLRPASVLGWARKGGHKAVCALPYLVNIGAVTQGPAHPEGVVITQQTIARRAGRGKTRTNAAIKVLRGLGSLVVVEHAGGNGAHRYQVPEPRVTKTDDGQEPPPYVAWYTETGRTAAWLGATDEKRGILIVLMAYLAEYGRKGWAEVSAAELARACGYVVPSTRGLTGEAREKARKARQTVLQRVGRALAYWRGAGFLRKSEGAPGRPPRLCVAQPGRTEGKIDGYAPGKVSAVSSFDETVSEELAGVLARRDAGGRGWSWALDVGIGRAALALHAHLRQEPVRGARGGRTLGVIARALGAMWRRHGTVADQLYRAQLDQADHDDARGEGAHGLTLLAEARSPAFHFETAGSLWGRLVRQLRRRQPDLTWLVDQVRPEQPDEALTDGVLWLVVPHGLRRLWADFGLAAGFAQRAGVSIGAIGPPG